MATTAPTTTDHSDEVDTKEDPVQEIRCLIDNNQVGGIIGKAGANVKRVREESLAFVSILKAEFRNVHQRIMVVKGTATQVAKATELIAELLVDAASGLRDATSGLRDKKDADPEADQQTSIRYLVHRSAVGAIIGKAGAVIQETQKQTGARVQVSNEPLPQSTEKSVTISGVPKAIHQACLRVLVQLRDSPLRTGTKVYPYVPGQPIFAQPAYGLAAQQPPPSQYAPPVTTMYSQQQQMSPYLGTSTPQTSSTQKIAIPTVCAGCVIGKGGSVIRDLRAQSNTNISIADPESSSPNERVVTLTGTPAGIQTAVFLIRQLVEQYQPPPPQPQQY